MLDVNRTAYRYEPIRLPDEDETRADIVDKACNYGRVGYRMVKSDAKEGKIINHKRVEHMRENTSNFPKTNRRNMIVAK